MIELRITGIRKDNGNHDNPYEAVEAYRWEQPGTTNGAISDRATVVSWVDRGYNCNKVQTYVQEETPRADCFVNESARGTRFLQTKPDATEKNNLLDLPPV